MEAAEQIEQAEEVDPYWAKMKAERAEAQARFQALVAPIVAALNDRGFDLTLAVPDEESYCPTLGYTWGKGEQVGGLFLSFAKGQIHASLATWGQIGDKRVTVYPNLPSDLKTSSSHSKEAKPSHAATVIAKWYGPAKAAVLQAVLDMQAHDRDLEKRRDEWLALAKALKVKAPARDRLGGGHTWTLQVGDYSEGVRINGGRPDRTVSIEVSGIPQAQVAALVKFIGGLK